MWLNPKLDSSRAVSIPENHESWSVIFSAPLRNEDKLVWNRFISPFLFISNSTVIGARMSHWKIRQTKQHPSRARSGHHISCSSVSLHFLCDILAPITVDKLLKKSKDSESWVFRILNQHSSRLFVSCFVLHPLLQQPLMRSRDTGRVFQYLSCKSCNRINVKDSTSAQLERSQVMFLGTHAQYKLVQGWGRYFWKVT